MINNIHLGLEEAVGHGFAKNLPDSPQASAADGVKGTRGLGRVANKCCIQ